jgi:LacI family transcriptional regulator
VAISTVSRVLNDSIDVSERTRLEVLKAIEDLRYHPSRTARSLAQQEYHSFAVAIPSFTAPFQNELLKGIRSFIREPGLDLLICDLGSQNVEVSLRSFLQRGAVNGLLVCGVSVEDQLADELMDIQSPTVVVGYSCPAFDSFYGDDTQGAETAVSHLISMGHRNICMIRAAVESDTQKHRISGYRNALEKAGIPYNPERIVSGNPAYHSGFSEEDGFDAMKTILKEHPDTTAVMASSDVQAIGAMAAIKEAGLSIPQDMALVGYDDIKTSRFIGLSSVDQSMQQIGFSAAKRLHERVTGAQLGPPQHILVEPKLEIRASSSHRIA